MTLTEMVGNEESDVFRLYVSVSYNGSAINVDMFSAIWTCLVSKYQVYTPNKTSRNRKL